MSTKFVKPKDKINNNTSKLNKSNLSKDNKDDLNETNNESARKQEEDKKAENAGENGEVGAGDNKDKKKRVMKPRLKFDFTQCFENEKGIRLLYDNTIKLKVKDSNLPKDNLNNIMQIYKNWHFQLFPKYDFELFTNRLIDLGHKKSGQAFMSRLRKVYKGEATWEDLIDLDRVIEEPINQTNNNINNANANEKKVDNSAMDFNLNDISELLIGCVTPNKNTLKENKVIENEEDFILENLNEIEDRENENEDMYDIMYENEKEFENKENNKENIHNKHNKENIESIDDNIEIPKKRKFSEVFPEADDKEFDNEILHKKID